MGVRNILHKVLEKLRVEEKLWKLSGFMCSLKWWVEKCEGKRSTCNRDVHFDVWHCTPSFIFVTAVYLCQKMVKYFTKIIPYHWRIQPGADPEFSVGGVAKYDFAKFSNRLHEIEKNLDSRGWTPGVPLDPPPRSIFGFWNSQFSGKKWWK